MKVQSLASRRRAVLLAFFAVVGVAVTSLVTSAPALAKEKTCAEQVVDDWYDNQRVDKLYPLHCYREAIANLPLDITDYSDAKEAILRALAYREAGLPDPGAGRSTAGSVVKPIAYRHTADVVVAIKDAGPRGSTNTAGPSSVPVPLIVLAGLAGLLLLAGGAGYVARRVQARRGDGGGPPAT